MTGSTLGRTARLVSVWVTLTMLPMLLAVVGCGANDLIPPPPVEPGELYWDLDLNHHAVALSPHDSLTLVATPRNFKREPLADLPAPQYESDDEEHLIVTPDGVLIAVAPTSAPVRVTATITAANLKHTDWVWVRVLDMDPVPVLAELSMHPVPPDSAKVASAGSTGGGLCGHLPLFMTDVSGTSLVGKGIPVSLRSSDTTVALANGAVWLGGDEINPFSCDVEGRRPGTTRLYATTTAFGVTKADTLNYRVGWPIDGSVQVVPAGAGRPGNVFVERQLTLGAGGVVIWRSSALKETAEVVFDDLTNVLSPHERPNAWDRPGYPPEYLLLVCDYFGSDCNSGNPILAPLPPGVDYAALRLFPTAGTYEFRDAVSGDRARIVVVDER